MTEQELIALACKGDEDAFSQLVRDNEKRVYGLALRLTGNPEDAMDMAQEAFLRAWRGLPSFHGESSFSTWIYRLTSNVCIDHLRRQKRRRPVEDTAPLDDLSEPAATAPPQFDPQTELERAELRRAVDRGLSALPDHHRRVLVMRELSGLSYQEIGQALELDIGTVKSRIARARMALRKLLLLEGNFSETVTSIPIETKGKE